MPPSVSRNNAFDLFYRLLKADQILAEAAERLRALELGECADAVEACRAPLAERLDPLQDRIYADFAVDAAAPRPRPV